MYRGPNATIPPRTKSPVKPKASTGKASGKRTLAEVMEHDIANKKKRHDNFVASSQSRFFGEPFHPKSPVAGPSRIPAPEVHEKENIVVYELSDEDLDSMLAQGHVDSDVIELEEPNPVEQEDGYISPSHSTGSGDADILTSPVHHRSRSKEIADDFDVDAISSPPSGSRATRLVTTPIARRQDADIVLVQATPTPRRSSKPKPLLFGPDLRNAFGDEVISDVEDGVIPTSPAAPRSSPIPSPPTTTPQRTPSEEEERSDPEEAASKALVSRREVVAAGWREKWALGAATLRRRETNVMHGARYRQVPLIHSRSHPYLSVHTSAVSERRKSSGSKAEAVKGRKSLGCLEDERSTNSEILKEEQFDTTAVERAQQRFQRFR